MSVSLADVQQALRADSDSGLTLPPAETASHTGSRSLSDWPLKNPQKHLSLSTTFRKPMAVTSVKLITRH